MQNGSSQYFGTKVHLNCFRFPPFVRNTPLLFVTPTLSYFLFDGLKVYHGAWGGVYHSSLTPRCHRQHSGTEVFGFNSAPFSAKAATVLMVELVSCTIVLLTCFIKTGVEISTIFLPVQPLAISLAFARAFGLKTCRNHRVFQLLHLFLCTLL